MGFEFGKNFSEGEEYTAQKADVEATHELLFEVDPSAALELHYTGDPAKDAVEYLKAIGAYKGLEMVARGKDAREVLALYGAAAERILSLRSENSDSENSVFAIAVRDAAKKILAEEGGK